MPPCEGETAAEICALYATGANLDDVGRETGLSRERIRATLLHNGVTIRGPAAKNGKTGVKAPEKTDAVEPGDITITLPGGGKRRCVSGDGRDAALLAHARFGDFQHVSVAVGKVMKRAETLMRTNKEHATKETSRNDVGASGPALTETA